MRICCLIATLLTCLLPAARAQEAAVYKDPSAGVEERVDDLLAKLTLEEKVALTHGAFTSGGIPRLGIAPLKMLDGRQGLRPVDEDKGKKTTLLPCGLALSCTWDEAAAREFGKVLAEEMLAMDRHVLLAPMLNLVRSPLGGRNFENFGEDPFLVGRIGAAYIQGVQEQGVGACACLLVANDCEQRRHQTSSNMDQRTLRELHIAGYEYAVREGKVWSMMSGNNLFNGTYCGHDRQLIQELVKDSFGFDGVMITDWRAAYETVAAALAGTDMTTGICSYVFGDGRLLKAVQDGRVPTELLEDKVRRILRLYVRSGVLDPDKRPEGGLDTPEHRAAARQLGAESMVLLKNSKELLPLDPQRTRRLLITGPAADMVLQGGGSGSVPAAVNISPLQGLESAWSDGTVKHIPYKVPLRPQIEKGNIEWEQAATRPGQRRRQRAAARANPPAEAGAPPAAPPAADLAQAARDADAVVFLAAGTLASEGRDLPHMDLPGGQADAIAAIAAANPNVIVVLVNNGPVTLEPWADKVSAILAIHYAGQSTGEALADVLTGKVTPGGKLSYTFGKRLDDFPAHALDQWPAKLILPEMPPPPGIKPEERKPTHAFDTNYPEGVFAGYRWFDEKQIEPAFPFGHGLSYTTFEFSDLEVVRRDREFTTVRCTVKNTGKRAGSEVVQVYVAPPKSSVPRPPRELKGFRKVRLEAGEAREVVVSLPPGALAFFDESSGNWKAEPGEYLIEVGASSRDIRLKAATTLDAERAYAKPSG